jgi:hypothetical protein
VANPVKALLDTHARRVNGETKHRMSAEMHDAQTGFAKCLSPGCNALFRVGSGPNGKPMVSEDSAIGSPCPNPLS